MLMVCISLLLVADLLPALLTRPLKPQHHCPHQQCQHNINFGDIAF
jgi:hypothetical protein